MKSISDLFKKTLFPRRFEQNQLAEEIYQAFLETKAETLALPLDDKNTLNTWPVLGVYYYAIDITGKRNDLVTSKKHPFPKSMGRIEYYRDGMLDKITCYYPNIEKLQDNFKNNELLTLSDLAHLSHKKADAIFHPYDQAYLKELFDQRGLLENFDLKNTIQKSADFYIETKKFSATKAFLAARNDRKLQ